MYNISLDNINVNGIDTLQYNTSIKNYLLQKKKIGTYKIPILKNINFEAKSGDRIGLLGLNGSGKSSLMKVIAGIYPICSGSLSINGKITAIIETGFPLDGNLSSKDNIKRSFIMNNNYFNYNDKIVDEILSFADIEENRRKMLVSAFSSGMQAKLRFSTTFFQINNCNILLLDEALATADMNFIQKADNLLKNQWNNVDIAITTSHNLREISDTCNKCYIIHKGEIVNYGTTDAMIDEYKKFYVEN